MTIDAWAAFAAAALTLMAMPGPTNLVLLSYGLSLGRRAVWPAVLGVVLGRMTALGLAILGAGTLLATAPLALAVLKAAGTLYLAWIGVRLWRAGSRPPPIRPVPQRPAQEPADAPPRGAAEGAARAGRVLRHVGLLTLLNPFNLAYFTVLFPHAPSQAGSPWAEAAVMSATFLVLSVAVSLLYGLLAAQAHGLWASPRFALGCNRCCGTLLVGGAVALMAGG